MVANKIPARMIFDPSADSMLLQRLDAGTGEVNRFGCRRHYPRTGREGVHKGDIDARVLNPYLPGRAEPRTDPPGPSRDRRRVLLDR
jgi:hypothetical protein